MLPAPASARCSAHAHSFVYCPGLLSATTAELSFWIWITKPKIKYLLSGPLTKRLLTSGHRKKTKKESWFWVASVILVIKAIYFYFIIFLFSLILVSHRPQSVSVPRAKGCHILFANVGLVNRDLNGFLETSPDWEEIFYEMYFFL